MEDKETLKKKAPAYSGLYRRAVVESVWKLDPRKMIKNPVMFVVEVGSVLTTALWVQALLGHGEAPTWFIGNITHVALVHGALRELRRGAGRRQGQGPGGVAQEDA